MKNGMKLIANMKTLLSEFIAAQSEADFQLDFNRTELVRCPKVFVHQILRTPHKKTRPRHKTESKFSFMIKTNHFGQPDIPE